MLTRFAWDSGRDGNDVAALEALVQLLISHVASHLHNIQCLVHSGKICAAKGQEEVYCALHVLLQSMYVVCCMSCVYC